MTTILFAPMKYISIVISFFIILVSCQTTDKTAGQPDKLIEKFKPFLNGIWVTSDYLDDIARTKSPLKSSEKLIFITEFTIDTTGVSDDSIHISAGLGNHEGYDFILYFRQGQTLTSLLTGITDYDTESNSYELGYIINNHDTSLVLYHYDKNKKLLDETKYTKVPQSLSDNNLGDGLQYIVNKKLISGTYKEMDEETIVELTNSGKITGFYNYSTYYVITDFVAGPENTTDKICFEIQTNDQRCYGFKINGDTLNLIKLPEDETDTIFQLMEPIYKFVRQN